MYSKSETRVQLLKESNSTMIMMKVIVIKVARNQRLTIENNAKVK
jgi:hypothetical protein